MPRVLVVTNDFPPRRGGIESFVQGLCGGLPADDLVVFTARMAGSSVVDRALRFPVVRDRSRNILPTPAVARRAAAVVRRYGCDRVVFGAAAPLALMTPALRAAGIRRAVALTHGHEVWWATIPGARGRLRAIGERVDVLTFVSEYCRAAVAKALRPADAARMCRLAPGVDVARFRPDADPMPGRRLLDVPDDRPVVLAVSRLVRRKGHDVLLDAWPLVLRRHPTAVLAVVGDGRLQHGLRRRVARLGLEDAVRIHPGVSWPEMPPLYASARVFALPCRTRLLGLEPEALGIVFLEAAASGLPIVVGRSGGAPETVVDGQSGYVVDPRSPVEIADRISMLLDEPALGARMGIRGRDHVARRFSEHRAVQTLADLLGLD